MTIDELISNKDALRKFNSVSRTERAKLLPELDPSFNKRGTIEKFSMLDKLELLGGPKKQPDYFNEPGLIPQEPFSTVGKLADVAGEATAEKIGEKGFPRTGAALGTAIQMAPDIAMGAMGGAKLEPIAEEGIVPAAKKVGGVLFGPGRAAVGKRIAAQEAKKGIVQSVSAVPKDTAEFVNEVARVMSGKTDTGAPSLMKKVLVPQQLSDIEEQLATILENEPSPFARLLGTGKSELGRKGRAIAAATKEKVTDLLHSLVPGREELFWQYANAAQREKLLKAALVTATALILPPVAKKALTALKKVQ